MRDHLFVEKVKLCLLKEHLSLIGSQTAGSGSRHSPRAPHQPQSSHEVGSGLQPAGADLSDIAEFLDEKIKKYGIPFFFFVNFLLPKCRGKFNPAEAAPVETHDVERIYGHGNYRYSIIRLSSFIDTNHKY
jgi:hypothetical protein